jgi:5-methylcytosine-specific restriction endonuclease McrA
MDLSSLSLNELVAELATLASHLNAGTCRWLELVGEVDRRGDWTESGSGSCAEWLAWRCAVSPRAAREHVRVARRLPELPLIRAAFAGGELSYAKVRPLTRVADAKTEPELLTLARAMTASQLERAVRAYRRVTTDVARDQQERAHLGVFWNSRGSLEIHGELASEDGALLLRALEAMRDSTWRGSAEPRPARQASNAEALVAIAEASLSGPAEARPGGERYQVVVHADESALADDRDGACELEDGSAIAPETARRLACDASVVKHGRKTRTIPPAIRRALRSRDRGCRFPGCENRRFLDAHHIHHWAKGGPTTVDNLLLLCRRHHRSVHEGDHRVDEHGRFYNRWGEEISAAPPLPPGRSDELIERNNHLAIDADTCGPGEGARMDLAYVVDVMIDIARAPRVSPVGPRNVFQIIPP